MSSKGVISDYLNPGSALDENTILTDYWLDFVAVRQEVEEPDQPWEWSPIEDVDGGVEDFRRRIEFLQADQSDISTRIEKTVPTGPLVGEARFGDEPNLGRQNSQPHSASRIEVFQERRSRPLADWFRKSFLYNAVQRLK